MFVIFGLKSAVWGLQIEDLAGFKTKMDRLNVQIDELAKSAVNAIGSDGMSASESAHLVGRLDQIMKRVAQIEQKLHNTSSLIESGRMFANDAGFVVSEAEKLVRRCFDAISDTRNYLENEVKSCFAAIFFILNFAGKVLSEKNENFFFRDF